MVKEIDQFTKMSKKITKKINFSLNTLGMGQYLSNAKMSILNVEK